MPYKLLAVYNIFHLSTSSPDFDNSTPKIDYASLKKNVQIVQSVRKGNSIIQKIVRHVGAAFDEKELEQLKLLAQSIKEKMEAENKGLLFSPEELAKATITKDKLAQSQEYTEADYIVNVKNLKEEDRIVSGIHDVYGKLFDELGFNKVLRNPARNVNSVQILKDIVMARIANPVSKMASVSMLEENFGVSIKLDQISVMRSHRKYPAKPKKSIKSVPYPYT